MQVFTLLNGFVSSIYWQRDERWEDVINFTGFFLMKKVI